MFELKPIQTRADYEMALDQIEPYFDNPASLDHETEEWVNALAVLIDEYEERAGLKLDTSTLSAIDAIQFRLDQLGLAPSELASRLGKKTQFVQDILDGHRDLSADLIKQLHKTLGIPMEALLR